MIKEEQELFGNPVRHIRADGDKGFQHLEQFFRNITFYFQSSKFTYHNKIVDAVIRTLRNALGPRSSRYWNGNYDDKIQQLVEFYNETWHSEIKIAPIEMHTDVELEWAYIRRKIEELNAAKKKQIDDGLYDFKYGDKVLVYLDLSKTAKSMKKRRRNFDRQATFIRYQNGNAVVRLEKSIVNPHCNLSEVVIPIYFVKSLG